MRENEVEHSPELARPFCFCVVVWGEQFRNYFLQYCLPSLLAPGNIPALAGERPAEYIIATTAEDWQAMRGRRYFALSNVTQSRFFLSCLRRLPISRTGSIRSSALSFTARRSFRGRPTGSLQFPTISMLTAQSLVSMNWRRAAHKLSSSTLSLGLWKSLSLRHSRKWDYCRTPIAVIPVRRWFIGRASWFQPHSDRFIA